MSHPLLYPNDYPNFLDAVERFLADNSSVFSCPVIYLLEQTDMRSLDLRIREYHGTTKSTLENFQRLEGVWGNNDPYKFAGALAGILGSGVRQRYLEGPAFRNIDKFIISKPLLSQTEELATYHRAFAELVTDGEFTLQEWRHWYALTTWDSGTCNLKPLAGYETKRGMHEVQRILLKYLADFAPSFAITTANFQAKVAAYAKRKVVRPLRPATALVADTRGERWMKASDMSGSRAFTTDPKAASLLLGYLKDTSQAIYFSGHESLITVGSSGAGKTASQVLPNLLRYPGSAVVLDVKGDLWKQTAGYRKSVLGQRVIRFAPGDLSGNTNRYNVFDLIPDGSKPGHTSHYCSILAQQLVPDNPHAKEKFWDNSAREIIWSCAMMVALKNTGEYRTMAGLARLVNFPLSEDENSKSRLMAASMIRNGERLGIQQLSSNAEMWMPQNKKFTATTNSMFATARAMLTTYGKTPQVVRALSSSDWTPTDLRKKPTTVYFCMSADDLRTYSAIIRILLLQHSNVLQEYHAKPDEAPITFFIDELPKLGNFQSILDLQDIGRSAGLRLWMFCQTITQLSTAFGGDAYLGVIDGCRVRSFMQSDNATVDYLEPSLSTIKKLGMSTDAVSSAELLGPNYMDKIIVTSANEKPMILDKHYSYKLEPEKMLTPPPVS